MSRAFGELNEGPRPAIDRRHLLHRVPEGVAAPRAGVKLAATRRPSFTWKKCSPASTPRGGLVSDASRLSLRAGPARVGPPHGFLSGGSPFGHAPDAGWAALLTRIYEVFRLQVYAVWRAAAEHRLCHRAGFRPAHPRTSRGAHSAAPGRVSPGSTPLAGALRSACRH